MSRRCTCTYDDDGGPYGIPHWDTDPRCPVHGKARPMTQLRRNCTCPYDDEGGPDGIVTVGRDPDCPVHGKDRPMDDWDRNRASGVLVTWGTTATGTSNAICPDLLSIADIGEADGWRGRMVRAFFRVLRVVTGV